MPFAGAKLALLTGDQLIAILRDDRPDIPWPGYWDLPGGGREPGETPVDCVLRETREELGLDLGPERIFWGRRFEMADAVNWFFVAPAPDGFAEMIRFGDEGQRWEVMRVADFIGHPKVVPNFRVRLQIFLDEEEGWTEKPPADLSGGR